MRFKLGPNYQKSLQIMDQMSLGGRRGSRKRVLLDVVVGGRSVWVDHGERVLRWEKKRLRRTRKTS